MPSKMRIREEGGIGMSDGMGSLRAWEKEGAEMMAVVGVKGARRAVTRMRRDGASNVKAAPRRACA